MKQTMYEKLRILAEGAKYDVSCSSSGASRSGGGRRGSAAVAGCCHSWSADGRCISLLKILFTNKCVYNCAYCVNRRTADIERAAFEPIELARLTMEFYRRNYIEGLFLSSAVDESPDRTSEKMAEALRILRKEMGFGGYIHTKVIPGTSPELVHVLGLLSDRLSINTELPTRDSLALLAPQKKPEEIFTPMKQIKNTLIERNALRGPGNMFRGVDLSDPSLYLTPGGQGTDLPVPARGRGETFAPAGQTTQMIIGADNTTDRKILETTQRIYQTFMVKRVYFSAYVPVVSSPFLPGPETSAPLLREHRLYQADWLLRFYGFDAEEILPGTHPDLDLSMDPKCAWALRNLNLFPIEVNRADLGELMRIPGIGSVSARRILQQRRVCRVQPEDLPKMGVVMKRARYFLTCDGKFQGDGSFDPGSLYRILSGGQGELQLSMFGPQVALDGERRERLHG